MMIKINEHQADKLAAFIATIRADWDPPGVKAALAKARDRGDAAHVAQAMIRYAADERNRTPGAFHLDGPHWRPPTADEAHRSYTPPPLTELCTEHGTARTRCGCAQRRPVNPAERADRNRRWAAHIRTQLGWNRNHDTNDREEVTQ